MYLILKFVRTFTPWMLAAVLCWSAPGVSFADASSASLSITVSDTSGAFIPDAKAVLRNSDTNQEQQAVSSKTGSAIFPFLKPGHYALTVSRGGFSEVTVGAILLNVGDNKHLQVVLKVGSASQSITVDGSGATINTTDGSVSTVIERQFVANIPLNGNSFQDLISMTPGVVTESPQTSGTSPGTVGDFSINGQRTESNYYMVDGVSANASAGSGTGSGYGVAGTVAATSALGTTQSLLSVDDLQEFRVESSSYSAEFGRSPGGQLTFVTRSGTDKYHGSAYNHFRNGWFDANDWFNDELGQAKEEVHQNDFGGTFGGPLSIPRLYQGKGKTFFFGSYEGLRLAEPVAASVQYVPDLYLREQAPAVLQPILNAFPLPTPGGIDYGTPQAPNLAEFFEGYSLPGKIDSSSIRIDQTFTPAFSAFFRFADTPSSLQSRFLSLSVLTNNALNVQTSTLGTTYALSQSITNQFRLGYSRSSSGSTSDADSFGGAVPTDLGKAMGNTNGITGQTANAEFFLEIPGSGETALETPCQNNQQQQWNVTDTFDIVHRAQQWKFGIDFRKLSTEQVINPFIPQAEYLSAQSILSNSATVAEYGKYLPSKPVYNEFALFAQDDWRINSRLSFSGGVRWELAPPPHNATNPQPYTTLGNLSNPSSLSLAPDGTPMWHASLGNLAPRLGIAWQANTLKNWATVIRGGGGVFFDTNNETALFAFSGFGFSTFAEYESAPMPFTTAQQNISVSVAPPYTDLIVSPPHLQLPYTLEWNTAIEQGLGQNNIATISYLGSAGRRLSTRQELDLSTINPSFNVIEYVLGVTSDYDALQTKFQRNVSKGVNALVSYSWSHSIDYGSNSGALMVTRGNSDFDVRQSFQAGLTWELPYLQSSGLTSGLLNGWALDGRLIARTAFPVTLEGNFATDPATGSEFHTNVNLVPNQPIYLYSRKFAGGRSLNPAAFAYPTGTGQGNAPRNFARGFGESQVNFAVRRDFPLSERVHLQFRTEAFNILNHPNFGFVEPDLNDSTFGQATQMLNQSLGTVASQYQQGGPRSMQFALRLAF